MDGPKCCSIIITETGIKKLLLGLDLTKAPGPGGISPWILKVKELAVKITPDLNLLYQSSLNSRVVPQDWQTVSIIPVLKKGECYRLYQRDQAPGSGMLQQ